MFHNEKKENILVPVVWDNGSTASGKEAHGYFNHARVNISTMPTK